jgi:2-dehydropantoate 2-reductase
MNIVILGAGAIGSLFGALLSQNNNVTLIGRPLHIKTIRKKGLKIEGKTKFHCSISAFNSIDDIIYSPDILIITVKSYDTENAIRKSLKLIDNNTIVLSFQNGLDTIDRIKNIIDDKQIIAGVTTHGSTFLNPGLIKHTGIGKTILGELNGKKTKRIEEILHIFNEAGIETDLSYNIIREIWIKTIINSSINPLTTIFQCKNGYILKNPILKNILERICKESTNVAKAEGYNLRFENTLKKTIDVIKNTSDNYSSMLQSLKKGKKTEIESINGKIIEIGKKRNIEIMMNYILFYLINSININL